MSSFVSRWVVRREHRLRADELTADGIVRADAVEQWIGDARDEYLAQCRVVAELIAASNLTLHTRIGALPEPEFWGHPTMVVVSAGVNEVYPDSFRMAFRVRSYGQADADVVANLTGAVSLVDPTTGEPCELGDAVRDELIALEHAARHTN
jgi:hypothetical protein